MSLLFSPLALGGVEMANRVTVSPMCQYSAREGTCLQQKLAGPVDALLVEHVAHAALELDRG